MNRTAIVMLTLAAVVLGASLGVLGGVFAEHRLHGGPRPPWMHGGFGPGPHPPIRMMLPHLARVLDLTPDQVKRIEAKVLVSQKEFETARESLRSRIEVELTSEQRSRWRLIERERRRTFPGEPGGEPGHPDRPEAGDQGEHR
jgi:hypothetical protein